MNKKLVNACILCLIIIVGCILINTFRGKNNINEGFAPAADNRDGIQRAIQREPDESGNWQDETEEIEMSYTALDEDQVGTATGVDPLLASPKRVKSESEVINWQIPRRNNG